MERSPLREQRDDPWPQRRLRTLPALTRRATNAIALSVLSALVASASTPPAATVNAEELAATAPLRPWELTGNLRTAFGYKENVLLSAVRPDDSAFVQAEGELFWWRLPTERFEALAFANAALTRFLDSDENPREWQAFAHAEARWFAAPTVQATGIVEGYHLDQVFDLSASDAERLTAKLAVTGALVSTALRWDIRPHTWLEFKPTVQRDRYRDGSDDNRQHLGRLTLGHTLLRNRLELALSAQALRRDYASRPQYTTAGRALLGTDLAFHQRLYETRAVVRWDEAQRWTTTTTATVMTNDDNGSGFFDYRHRTVRQELAWTRAPWKAKLISRAGRYDYDVQTQGIGIDPPKRLKEEFLGQARLERHFAKNLLGYFDFIWERSRSNDPLASYRVQTTSAGVDWSF